MNAPGGGHREPQLLLSRTHLLRCHLIHYCDTEHLKLLAGVCRGVKAAEGRAMNDGCIEDAEFPPAVKTSFTGESVERRQPSNNRRRVRVLPAGTFCPETAPGVCRAIDAAAFLANAVRPVSWLKLQDLLYFAQAWHLVWDSELLFAEPLLAAEEGVQVEIIEALLKNYFDVTARNLRAGVPDNLTESQKRTLLGVAKHYAQRSHYRLSKQIREGTPWQAARAAAEAGQPGQIDPADLYRYYRDL